MSAVFEWERVDDVRETPARSGRARLELPVELESGGASCAAVTCNISQEGAFVATPRLPSVGERVTLKVLFPAHVTPIAVDAEVRWRRAPSGDEGGGRSAGIGVRFIDPPFGVSLCLAWLLHSHEAR